MLKPTFVFAVLFHLSLIITGTFGKFKVVREWNYVNFTWPSEGVYKEAVEQQRYVPENNIIAGIKYYDGFYYITLPRMKSGVPATLTRIPSGLNSDTSPLLTPFPSWEMNNVDDCSALQNVQNVEIDIKGQIWIIDGGRTETLSKAPVIKCKPKLLIYDVKTMENVLTYTFSENTASSNGSFLYDIVLDDGYAYITDNSNKDPGIIVFSVKDQRSWKIRHSQSMRADSNAALFQVNDVPIRASLNIASIALGPRIHTSNDRIVVDEEREVYYAPLSSLHLYSISTSVLRNEEFSLNSGEYQGQVKDYGLKASQSVGMIMDNQGVLYYSLLATNSIARWDTNTPFQTGQKIIAKDDRYLEWPNSFTFDASGNLTLLVNRLNKFIYEKLKMNEPNFRLIASHIGGKSYLYDETYNYNRESSTSNAMGSSTVKDEPQPEPTVEPETIPEPEPTASPSNTTVPSRSTSATVTSGKPTNIAVSDRLATGVLSVLAAIMVFVF